MIVKKQVKKPLKKNMNGGDKKTTGLYKIAASIIKKVKSGSSYKTQLYQAIYPNKLSLNAVLMNVFKWEKVIDVLIDKSKILEKEKDMDSDLLSVLITEMMWSKFGLKGYAKNILAIKKYKDEFEQIIKDNNLENIIRSIPQKDSKPRYFRVNTLLTSLKDMLQKLSELKFRKLKTPTTYAELLELIKSDKFNCNTFVQDVHIKELLIFNSKVKFYKFNEYNNGFLIVQDKASCLASYLLNPKPESIALDMCAAPGMKTSHLAAIMKNKGKLYAVDRSKERYNTLNSMMEKYGVKGVETFNMDALHFQYYDDVRYILLDPSCSGSGIVDRVRNDSTVKNENFQIRLKKLANVHAQLLNHALKSPNLERLVYSTCSKNPEENEAVVDEALSVNGKFKLLDCTKIIKGWTNKGAPGYDCSDMCINAVPDIDCTNGFFIAVFVRRDYEEKDEEINNLSVEESDEEVAEVNKLNTKTVAPAKKGKTSKTKKVLDMNKSSIKVQNTFKNEKNEDVVPAKKNKSMKRIKTEKNTEINESNIKVENIFENEIIEDVVPVKYGKSKKRIKTKKAETVNESSNTVENMSENEETEDVPTKKKKSLKKIKTEKDIGIIESNIKVENIFENENVPDKKRKCIKRLSILGIKTENVVEANIEGIKMIEQMEIFNELDITKMIEKINKNIQESSKNLIKNECAIKKTKKVTLPGQITNAMKRRKRKLKLENAKNKTTKLRLTEKISKRKNKKAKKT